ncbi:sensor histidine kinase [Nocardia brasiliensis]|uniref:sensor histidine kinase n=1 Tax=Nocardia brasiliensis TaxID=37326 RepID=UPI0018961320|nr:sensor histidine kinase [Nocardia brasiliensis]MBF6547993.1 CHASE3 domain-containing protein [Nocardia brasiliensis]
MTTTARSLAGRLTVQGWFLLVLALMVLLVLVGTGVGAAQLSKTNHYSDRLVDRLQPAAAETYRLQGALLNQETGIRGYAIGADPQFLTPYFDGKQEEAKAAARIRDLLADRPELLADLDTVERTADAWRTGYAEPLIAGVAARGSTAVGEVPVQRGKEAFDELRRHFATQSADLVAEIDRNDDELATARQVRDTVLGGMVAAFLVAAVVLTILVRRLVAKPLDELEAASQRVADGDFDHHISAHGPADLTTVAAAVEAMRRRVVAELASSRDQEAELERQAAELDAQTAELRRSNAELEQFAYVASHDLQEPLRKVAAFCQLLEKRYGDQLDERAGQYIAYAVDGAKRMQVLINDLLTFSRVGRVIDSNVQINLDQTMDKALANLSAAAEDTDLKLERPAELPKITGDPTLLTMLWQNLIGNAIKFRDAERAPVVRIDCEPDEEAGGWRFSVSDNGIGIAPEFADKVFVIFQRLHSREEYTGTGIGLALCKKIVEHHGGKIWLDTEYTGGTRFVFTLSAPSEPTPQGDPS